MNNNRTKKQVRMVDGIKVYFIAGVWYCDYNAYSDVAIRQGRQPSIDDFCNWCDKMDLSAQSA